MKDILAPGFLLHDGLSERGTSRNLSLGERSEGSQEEEEKTDKKEWTLITMSCNINNNLVYTGSLRARPGGDKMRDPGNQVVSTTEYWTPQLQTLSERLRFVLFLCKNWRVWGPILSLREIFIKLRMFT